MCFKVRRSISLYKLLITLTQAIRVFSSLIPIRAAFNLKFKDLIKLLISIKLF